MARDDRFLLAALGFSATSSIALAIVLLAFSVTGGIDLLRGDENPIASVSSRGIEVSLYSIGVADTICIGGDDVSFLYTANPGSKLAYAVIEVEPPPRRSAVIEQVTLIAGKAAKPIAPVSLHSGRCNAATIIEDAEPYNGGALRLDKRERVIAVFKVDENFERSGSIMLRLNLDGRSYTIIFELERCSVTEAKISIKGG